MNTLANNVASKLFVAVTAVAMLFSVAAPAKAATTEELQQMINNLMAQIAMLQGQTSQGATSVPQGVCPFTWTRSLKTGMTGADVMKLQQFLNADVDTRVAAAGAGSVGAETSYFGPATAAAVSKFQVKYRAEVLSPSGLVNPTGYFGPATMAKANSICNTPIVTPGTPTTPTTTPSTSLQGGEASIDNDFRVSDGDDTDLEEGQSNAPVMDVSFNVKNGDVRIDRIDVGVRAASGNTEKDPWDTFDTVSIWVDGEKVADMDTDSKGDWSKKSDSTGTYYTVRLTGLDWVVRAGEKAEFTVGVTTNNSIKGTTRDWTVFVPTDGVRANDSLNIQHYTGETSSTVSVSINDLGGDDELNLREATNNPDATTLELESNARSSWLTILGFNLDTDDSVNDITVNTLKATITVATGTASALPKLSDVVNKVQIVIDGQKYTAEETPSTTASTQVFTFDLEDEDVVIDAGDEMDGTLQVEFKALGSTFEGATIMASMSNGDMEAEGGDDLTGSQLKGSAVGKVHTLRTSGLAFTLKSSTGSLVPQDGNNNDYADYSMTVEVTAFGEDVTIPLTAARGASSTAGVAFFIEDANNGTVTTGTTTQSVQRVSGGTISGNTLKITEGSTATIKLNVTYTPGVAGQYRVQIDTVSGQDVTPDADFESSNVSVIN